MVRSRKYLLGILAVCLMLPLFMRAQQNSELKYNTVYTKSGAEPITNNLAKIILHSINLWQEKCKRQVRNGVCMRDTTNFLISSIGLPSEVIYNLPSNTKYVYDVSYGNELYKQARKNKNHSIGYTKIDIDLFENHIEIRFFNQTAVAQKKGKRQWWEISSSEYDAVFEYSYNEDKDEWELIDEMD